MRGGFAACRILCVLATLLTVFLPACSELENPEPRPYFAETAPPPVQEFRWSNGGIPKSFDPARASAAPETDIVRAVFEGLTETSSRTLDEAPAAAENWTVSDDARTWIFYIRSDAKWTNGKPVTAGDFARSWQRLADLDANAAHKNLLDNFARVASKSTTDGNQLNEADDFLRNQVAPAPNTSHGNSPPDDLNAAPGEPLGNTSVVPPATRVLPGKGRLAVYAVDERTLKVELIRPDRDFAKLAANPIFRPNGWSGNSP
jgi:ABC-type oligopeptide transport system substrate-binding subunit